VKVAGKSLLIDRNKLNSEGFGDFFTFTIDGERVSGKAAPNRYTGGYSAGPNNTLTVLPLITTLMATIYNPERIREEEYLKYLAKVKRWSQIQGRLQLYTVDEKGKEVILIYVN
jgi:heat shock protein HslJ